MRAALNVLVDAGQGRCWRCGLPINPGTAWHTGHDDTDRSVIRGAEHASCNLSAAASKGARAVNAARNPPAYVPPPCRFHRDCAMNHSRDW